LTEARGEILMKIDCYEIIDTIGYGAMEAVYKAFDPIIKRSVADTVRRQWRYEPATKNGVRLTMRWVQRFCFQQGR
jgi:hypothetical protein